MNFPHAHAAPSNARTVVLAALCFCAGALPWYAAVFPGVLTWDSYDQIAQASGWRPTNDYHSILITALLRLARIHLRLYILAQFLGFAVVIGWVFTRAAAGFRRVAVVQTRVPFLAALLCGALPTVAVFVFYLIKDVPFTACILGAFALCATALVEKPFGARGLFVFAVLSMGSWLFRHDGIAFAAMMLPMGAWAARPMAWRRIAVILAAGSALVLGIQVAAERWMDVRPTTATEGAWCLAFVQDVSGFLRMGSPDAADLQYVRQFADPAGLAAGFDFARGDTLAWRAAPLFDMKWVGGHKAEFFRGYFRLLGRNKAVFGRMRWMRFLHQVGIRSFDIFANADSDNCGYKSFSMNQSTAGLSMRRMLDRTNDPPWRWLLYCAVWPLLALVVVATVFARRSMPAMGVLALLPLAFFGVFSIVSPASTFRYDYVQWMLAIVLTLGAFSSRPRASIRVIGP